MLLVAFVLSIVFASSAAFICLAETIFGRVDHAARFFIWSADFGLVAFVLFKILNQ